MSQCKKCECGKPHEYQDDRYGTGKRVCICIQGDKRSQATYRCTVCGQDLKSSEAPMEIHPK